MENRYFPVFVPSAGKKAVVFGGGSIAARRVKTLAEFDFEVTVVSPKHLPEIAALAEGGRISLVEDVYRESYLKDCYMALACTDDRKINHKIGIDAKERGIQVTVCDNRQECTFYFPAVAVNEEVTAGICGSGDDHAATRKAAAKVREIIERKAY